MPATPEIDAIKQLVDTVHGWLRDEEGKLLYALARNCLGRGVIVEIGSFKGKSTIGWAGAPRPAKEFPYMPSILTMDPVS